MPGSRDPNSFDRTQLYEEVWTTPMEHIGKNTAFLVLREGAYATPFKYLFPSRDIGPAWSWAIPFSALRFHHCPYARQLQQHPGLAPNRSVKKRAP